MEKEGNSCSQIIFPDFFFPSQDIDTAIVSDTTDDLWFLNEAPLEQGTAALKVLDSEEVTEGDTKVQNWNLSRGVLLLLEKLDLFPSKG